LIINVINVYNPEILRKDWSLTRECGEFVLDGLLYSTLSNTFYMVESILNESDLENTRVKFIKMKTFLNSNRKPSNSEEKSFNRIWNWFFSKEDGLASIDANLE
jgi:hypothetical protein